MGISSRSVFDNFYITAYSQGVLASVFIRSILVSPFDIII